jgi:hypothetical protein
MIDVSRGLQRVVVSVASSLLSRIVVPFPLVSRWRNGERTDDLARTLIDRGTSFCVEPQRPCPKPRTTHHVPRKSASGWQTDSRERLAVCVGSGVRFLPAKTHWLRRTAHQTDVRRQRSPLGEVLRSISSKRETRGLRTGIQSLLLETRQERQLIKWFGDALSG